MLSDEHTLMSDETIDCKVIKVCFRAPSPHLDYYQDDEARLEFHKTNPLIDLAYSDKNMSEGHVLTGYFDTEDLKVGVMLGVWKPLNPTKVNLFLSSNLYFKFFA